MGFIVPRCNARRLHGRTHRAAVVRAVQQEFLEDSGVARHEPRAHARHVRALRQAREHDQTVEAPTQSMRCRQGAQWRMFFVEVDLGITLVGRNHEAEFVGEVEQAFPVGKAQHGAGRIARRAEIDKLDVAPDVGRHGVVVRREITRGIAVDVIGRRAGEQRGAFIDLVERVRTHHARAGLATVDDRLGERKERLARARDRQNFRGRIHVGQCVPALQPLGDRRAQRLAARGGRIVREAAQPVDQGFLDELRRRVLGFPDAEADGLVRAGRRDVRHQRLQAFKGVGLELVE